MNREMIEQVAARLDSAATRLVRQMRLADSPTDVSPARLAALATVSSRGPISLAALAATERVSAPTMSRIVESLVRDGLVEREQDPSNRRTVRISATQHGLTALGHGRKGQVEALSARLQLFGDSEKRALLRGIELMERLTKN